MDTTTYSHKGSGDKLDFRIDFGPWLANLPGDSPKTVSVTVTPAGVSIDLQPLLDVHPTVWLSGGIRGVEYAVVWKMETIGGRIKSVSIPLVVS